jgi:hypothetical protein
MFKLVQKRSKSTDIYLEEDELSAGLDHRGSKKVRGLFRDYQYTRSEKAMERVRDQVRKELGRWTPIRVACYIALAIILAVAVSFLSFALLNYVLHDIVSPDYLKPTITASSSLRPTGSAVSDPQVSSAATPVYKSKDKNKKNHVLDPATPEPSIFAGSPKTPSACASCSVPGLSQEVREGMGTVQNILNRIFGIASDLKQSVGQVILPTPLIPRSPAKGIPAPASPSAPVCHDLNVPPQVCQASGVTEG